MAHPDLVSKERIIYNCCLDRVFLTVVDTIWYNASVDQTYVYMTHRGKFPRPSRILWGCIFGPSPRLVFIWSKLNSWNIHPCRMVALSPRCSYTDPSTFVAFLPFTFVSMYSFIIFIAALILKNGSLQPWMQLWYCFDLIPWDMRKVALKEKLNPTKMGGAIFCGAECKWKLFGHY